MRIHSFWESLNLIIPVIEHDSWEDVCGDLNEILAPRGQKLSWFSYPVTWVSSSCTYAIT